MKATVVAAAAALVAAAALNVLLLSRGGDRHDPVGRLSPIAAVPLSPSVPAPAPTPPRAEHETRDD